MKNNRIFYENNIDKDYLWNLFCNNQWIYDVPRYITRQELIELIDNNYVIYKGDFLNGKTEMDADNYYCHLYDMHVIR